MATNAALEARQATHSFAAFCPKCGAMCAVILDIPSARKEIKRQTAEWVMYGLTVRRVTNEEVKTRFSSCRCESAETEATQPEAEQLTLF